MSPQLTVIRTTIVGQRRLHWARMEERDAEVYLLERLNPEERPPSHTVLPPTSGPISLDEILYWVVALPGGVRLADALQSGVAVSGAVLHTLVLGEALLELSGFGLLPGDFYGSLFWSDGHLILDYCRPRLTGGPPSFPQLDFQPPAQGAVVTLAAVLHSCLTRKAATAPPYVFLPVSRFHGGMEHPAEQLIQAGLHGKISLKDFVSQLAKLHRWERATKLLPATFARRTQSDVALVGRERVQYRALLDWGIWLACVVVGALVLTKFG